MNALARWIDSQYGRRSHLVVTSPDGQDNFALFGGFRARHRFAALYFREHAKPRTRIAVHAPVGSEHCRQLARRHGLVVFCGDTAPADLARELLTLPLVVDMEMDTPEVTTGPGASWSRSAKANIARVRRGRFDWDVATDPALIAEFHRRMYRPSMRGRHGAAAYTESRRRLLQRSRLEGLELLRIFQGGRWVAASLNESSSRGYRLTRVGWLNGDERLLESGVVAASYWFSFQRATALGRRRLLLGGVEPHLEDGSLLYKGHWGARFCDEQRDFGAFQLLLDPAHPACRRFLHAHSLIVRGSGGALIALSARTPAATVVAPGVLRGLRRWYTWRESPMPGPEGHADEVPFNLRPWVGASML
jgi:hypothetical protein